MSIDLFFILVSVIVFILVTSWKKFSETTKKSNMKNRMIGKTPELMKLAQETEALKEELANFQRDWKKEKKSS